MNARNENQTTTNEGLKRYKVITTDAAGTLRAHRLEADSRREAWQIVEAAWPTLTALDVFVINEVDAIIG